MKAKAKGQECTVNSEVDESIEIGLGHPRGTKKCEKNGS